MACLEITSHTLISGWPQIHAYPPASGFSCWCCRLEPPAQLQLKHFDHWNSSMCIEITCSVALISDSDVQEVQGREKIITHDLGELIPL